MFMIKYHNFFLLSPSLLGELWEVQNPSSCDIIIFQKENVINIFEKNISIFNIARTMASTLTLQLFRNRKPAVSISLDSQSMMSQDDGFLTCPQPSNEKRKKKKSYFFSEDQLYEDRLKSGEVLL